MIDCCSYGRFAGAFLALTAGSSLPAPAATADALFDRLICIPEQFQVLQASSHNRMGHNADSNKPLYKNTMGEDVIFDAAGPGCVRSMWGTNFPGDAVLNFYFDGERQPRYSINEIEFYSGKHPDFPAPLSSYEVRGHWGKNPYAGNCFVPIPFEKSLKISVAGKSTFFHVLYEIYPYGTRTRTFTGREDRTSLIDSFGQTRASPESRTAYEVVASGSEQNGPGSNVVLFERKTTSGIIRELSIEADATEAFFTQTELAMRWDGHERDDVRAPTGMFFGCAHRGADVTTLPVTVRMLPGGRAQMVSRFPMPFWKEARIVWRNQSSQRLGPLRVRLLVSPNETPQGRGTYFTTLYHQGQTTYRRDWPLYDSPGAGWFAGVVQSMQTQHYCEGNEHFYIDGAVSPQINGTGSEDYYLGCFWPNTIYNSPFATCTRDIQIEGGGIKGAYDIPSSYSRFHLEAPIPFLRSIDARIQHGGMSDIASNYRSLAFCYLRSRPALRQTDFINVGDTTSEQSHRYDDGDSKLTGLLTGRPEGEYFETAEDEDGRSHTGGAITFTVAIDPKNAGVRLRRRLDQSGPPQAADVYVDGEYAGRWTHTLQNPHLRWFDSDFDIHPRHTQGKAALTVKLAVAVGPELGPFTDFSYSVWCFESR